MTRVVLGFIAAALWIPLLLYVTAGAYGQFWFVMTTMFTVPLTFVLAVPLFYVWRKRITFGRCVLAGAGIGLVGALINLGMTNPLAALHASPRLIGAGLVSSLVFWVVAVWNNERLKPAAAPEHGNAAI